MALSDRTNFDYTFGGKVNVYKTLVVEDAASVKNSLDVNGKISISSPNTGKKLDVRNSSNDDVTAFFKNGGGSAPATVQIWEDQASSAHYGLYVGDENLENSVLVTKQNKVGICSSLPERTLDVVGSIRKTIYEPGEIIEEISGICDGSTIVGKSGSYTLTNVTAALNGTTSYQTITGSEITYTPPPGTKRVFYSFYYKFDVTENSGISHHIMHIDDNEVYPTAMNVASNYASTNWHHACFPLEIRMTINCDAESDDVNNGRFTSWTTAKILKVKFREYNSSYESAIHANTWWDGSSATGNYTIMKPHLTIRAIA